MATLAEARASIGIRGSVTYRSTQVVYPLLTGMVDMQGNFSFSIKQPNGQQPLYFSGTVQHNGGNILHGNFCSSTTNTCLSLSGYFTVGPGY